MAYPLLTLWLCFAMNWLIKWKRVNQDPALVEAVEMHRANEGTFRFETSVQLKEVENERIRLEKERRVSQQ